MRLMVGGVVVDSHFFTRDEIELSFTEHDVTEASLRDLLAFMIDLGDATEKPVTMTPESCPQSPILTYDHQLRWRPSGRQ